MTALDAEEPAESSAGSANSTRTTIACIVVPAGTWDLGPLVAAIHTAHPSWAFAAVWCGDPHRRPALEAVDGHRVEWCDLDLAETTGAGWGRLIVALAPRTFEWVRTATAVRRLLETTVCDVVVLRAGSAAVLGDLSSLVGTGPITLVPRTLSDLPDDGLSPSEADVVADGRWSTVVAAFAPGAEPALHWLSVQLAAATDGSPGQWLQRLADRFGATACDDPAIGAGPWRPPVDEPALLDLDRLPRDQPWYFTFDGPSRARMSQQPALARAVEAALPQIAGTPAPVVMPGAVSIDGPIRELMADALRRWRADATPLPAEPFGPHHSAFVRWLEEPSPIWGADIGRYWRVLREQRADLLAAFPRSDSWDQDRYVEWAEHSWQMEARSVLIRPSAGSPRTPVAPVGANTNGINVAGYLGFDASLGDVARRIVESLEAGHVPVDAIDHFRTGSPRRPDAPVRTNEAHFGTNLVVVNADQFHFFVADHGPTLLRGRRTIAYWFWELEVVPADMVAAIEFVDEIWVGSRFVARAFASVTDKPVRWIPIPIPEPIASKRSRASFGLPADRFVFVATFDHFSVAERKNPYGVVEAFLRAFPSDDGRGPVLFVKTVNGDRRWENHERLLLAAAGRDDIVVLDEHVSREDQMAVLAVSDCLVSLHRAEGLGLHCAEAMWQAKPVIATGYSGNVDFMDETNSLLIRYSMAPVTNGEGVYPATASWADPDLDHAAECMIEIARDPALARRLGTSARRSMQQQPSLRETGRVIARAAGLGPYGRDEHRRIGSWVD